MRYGFAGSGPEYSPMVDYSKYQEQLDAGVDHWQLLDEFVRDWEQTGPYTWEIADDRVRAVEQELGFELPVALKRWYAFGFRPLLYWNSPLTQVIYPELLGDRMRDGYVTFHTEAEDCCQWGFRVTDAALVDPPVYIGMEMDPEITPKAIDWFFQNATFSEWALQRVISDTVVGGATRAGYMRPCGAKHQVYLCDASADVITVIRERYQPLGFPKQLWYNHSLFGGPDVIFSISEPFLSVPGYWAYIGARSQAGLELAMKAIPAEWVDQSPATNSSVSTAITNRAWDGEWGPPVIYDDPFDEP